METLEKSVLGRLSYPRTIVRYMAVAEDLGSFPNAEKTDEIDAAMVGVITRLRALPTTEAVLANTKYQNWMLALEAELFARNKAEGASDRENEGLAGKGRASTKSESKKRAKRGAAVGENPKLGDDLAAGELGPDQVDAIAEAAGKTDGEAARDDELIEDVKSSAPEDARAIARRWVEDHNNPDGDGANARHQRQRRLRSVSKYMTKDDCWAILLKGDQESIEEMWSAMSTAARSLWRKDGGRDVPRDKHPRTRKQRMFDAAHQAFGSGSSTTSAKSSSTGARLNMWIELSDFLAGDLRASFANGRVVPATVLSRYMCNGTIAATVFDKEGEVIHHGREHRFATPAQIRALIARDRGCVRCRADVFECEAHHIIPWNAPLRGETNIEELALVCTDCHHFIHDTNQTLYRNDEGRWKLRPAKEGEIPAQTHRKPEKPPNGNRNRHKVRHE